MKESKNMILIWICLSFKYVTWWLILGGELVELVLTRVQALPKGHHINLRGSTHDDERGWEKELSADSACWSENSSYMTSIEHQLNIGALLLFYQYIYTHTNPLGHIRPQECENIKLNHTLPPIFSILKSPLYNKGPMHTNISATAQNYPKHPHTFTPHLLFPGLAP